MSRRGGLGTRARQFWSESSRVPYLQNKVDGRQAVLNIALGEDDALGSMVRHLVVGAGPGTVVSRCSCLLLTHMLPYTARQISAGD
jgi:hypothetical protein